MHQSFIIQHLFQVNSLEDVSRERLETFVEEYPSFGIGHYLLSRKLQKEDTGGFEEKTKLTCLYFSNPFWLQWLLENTDVGGQKAVPETKAFAALPLEEATQGQIDAGAEAPVVQEWSAAGEPPNIAVAHVEANNKVANHEEVSFAHLEHEVEQEAAPPVENVVTMAEEAFHVEPAMTPVMQVEAGREEGRSAAEELLRSIEQAREIRESLQKINTHFIDGTATAGEQLAPPVVAEEPVAAADIETVTAEPVTPVHEESPIRDEEVPFVLDEPESAAIAIEPASIAVEPTAPPVDDKPVEAPLVEATPAAPPVEIVFEPMHTIDYFASQGIKFNLEENPVDALGKQLKSFTDWLKIMRRLPQKNREVVPDRLAEQAIQNFAAHSIEGKEVLTEAMAEVLAKQGMRHRARAVYEKLSLLNPEKSAYFAAKIEQLNIY
jgi:hypothetical protein